MSLGQVRRKYLCALAPSTTSRPPAIYTCIGFGVVAGFKTLLLAAFKVSPKTRSSTRNVSIIMFFDVGSVQHQIMGVPILAQALTGFNVQTTIIRQFHFPHCRLQRGVKKDPPLDEYRYCFQTFKKVFQSRHRTMKKWTRAD